MKAQADLDNAFTRKKKEEEEKAKEDDASTPDLKLKAGDGLQDEMAIIE